DAGLIHPDKETIDDLFPDIERYVRKHYPQFEAHKTAVSVNIIHSQNNKRQGILKLCELMEVRPEETAYIGDSSGDIPGLKIVGYPFGPKNAVDEVKAYAEVLDARVTGAVLEAYHRVVAANRKAQKGEQKSAELRS